MSKTTPFNKNVTHPKYNKGVFGASSHWVQAVYDKYYWGQQWRQEIERIKEKREKEIEESTMIHEDS